MTILFKCKTDRAFIFKNLIDLLQLNIKTICCFKIDNDGIYVSCIDNVLINLVLEAKNFSSFVFKNDEPVYIGINLNYLNKMVKSIKKTDSLCLYIDSDNTNELGIKVTPKNNPMKVSTSFVNIQDIQRQDIQLPNGYPKNGILIPSIDYSKCIKELSQIGNTIDINILKGNIKFSVIVEHIMRRAIEFNSDDDTQSEESYSNTFNNVELYKLSKISTLSSSISIYSNIDNPLLFKCNIGDIGDMSIYVKSSDMS